MLTRVREQDFADELPVHSAVCRKLPVGDLRSRELTLGEARSVAFAWLVTYRTDVSFQHRQNVATKSSARVRFQRGGTWKISDRFLRVLISLLMLSQNT